MREPVDVLLVDGDVVTEVAGLDRLLHASALRNSAKAGAAAGRVSGVIDVLGVDGDSGRLNHASVTYEIRDRPCPLRESMQRAVVVRDEVDRVRVDRELEDLAVALRDRKREALAVQASTAEAIVIAPPAVAWVRAGVHAGVGVRG